MRNALECTANPPGLRSCAQRHRAGTVGGFAGLRIFVPYPPRLWALQPGSDRQLQAMLALAPEHFYADQNACFRLPRWRKLGMETCRAGGWCAAIPLLALRPFAFLSFGSVALSCLCCSCCPLPNPWTTKPLCRTTCRTPCPFSPTSRRRRLPSSATSVGERCRRSALIPSDCAVQKGRASGRRVATRDWERLA